MKKFSLILSIILILVFVFTGCNSNNNTNNEDKSKSNEQNNEANKDANKDANSKESKDNEDNEKKELVEISVEIFDRGNVPAGEGNYEENRWTKYINEQMEEYGISIKFVPIPRNEEVTKLNLLLASSDAPDLCYSYNNTEYHKWAESGGLLELSDLINEYGMNIKALYEKKPGLENSAKHNGEVFCVRGSGPVPVGNMLYMRKDWLDKVGLDVPTSPDEFYEALKAFKEKDPAGVGSENVVPWTVAMGGVGAGIHNEALFSAFDISGERLTDGQLLPVELNPGYEDYLIFMNKLYKEGLIDEEFPLDTSGERSREHIATNVTGAWNGNYNWINSTSGLANSLNHGLVSSVPEVEWVGVEVFPNKEGVKTKYAEADKGMILMIPKDSEDVAPQVIQYLDWLAKEGGEVIFSGFEGEHYELVNGAKLVIDTEHNAQTLDWAKWDYGIVRPFDYDGDYLKGIDPNEKFGQISKEAYSLFMDGALTRITFDRTIESDTKYGTELRKILEKGKIMAITGDDPSYAYEEMVEEYLSSGGQEVIKEKTAVYLEMTK